MLVTNPETSVEITSPRPIVASTQTLRTSCFAVPGWRWIGISQTELNANSTVRTTPIPLQSVVTMPRISAQLEPDRPFTDLGSSSGNMPATRVSTDIFSLAGSTQPSSVTSTSSNGKIEKKPQNAIEAASRVERSSPNFLPVATAIAARRRRF